MLNGGKLKTTPIYRALHRGNLFMGGDRELTMMSILSCFVLMVTLDPLAIIFGVVFAIFSVFLLRSMAKNDPDMRSVYLKHRQYQDFYSARSTPWRVDP
jgi:type IV secretion system protein VirB3